MILLHLRFLNMLFWYFLLIFFSNYKIIFLLTRDMLLKNIYLNGKIFKPIIFLGLIIMPKNFLRPQFLFFFKILVPHSVVLAYKLMLLRACLFCVKYFTEKYFQVFLYLFLENVFLYLFPVKYFTKNLLNIKYFTINFQTLFI